MAATGRYGVTREIEGPKRTSKCRLRGRKRTQFGTTETSLLSQNRKYRENSKPDADLKLNAAPANRELFKSRFAKARKMNAAKV